MKKPTQEPVFFMCLALVMALLVERHQVGHHAKKAWLFKQKGMAFFSLWLAKVTPQTQHLHDWLVVAPR